MRNKTKNVNKRENTTVLHRGQPRRDNVIVLSESSCSEEDSASLSEKGTYGSNFTSAGCSTSNNKTPLKQRETLTTRDIKIAPIFLHIARRSRSRRSGDEKQEKSAERLKKSVPPILDEGVQQEEKQSTTSSLTWSKLFCREKLSASVLQSCLEEIQRSNPAFPARAVFNTLKKKASEGLQASESTENSSNLSSLQSQHKEKRKRGFESSERVPKRLKSSLTAESPAGLGHCHTPVQSLLGNSAFMGKKSPRRRKLSRTHRLRQHSGSPAGLVKSCELNSGLRSHTETDSQSHSPPDSTQIDLIYEDVLWTDKYSPRHSSEVIGNSESVDKLQSWLKKWKLRADCEERRRMMEDRRREESSNDSWDCGDFLGEDGAEEEPLCNTMLITGPPGVGKTASVYACSQELGFKVFEVNCSSQRSGHRVLSQLKEATQSHLVETSGKDPLKPAYFNSYSSTTKSETLPGKTVTPKNITFTSKKRAAQSLCRPGRKAKSNSAAVTLANYFKMKNKADLLHSGGLSSSEKPGSKKSDHPSTGSGQSVPQSKKTATSLILFEEVDVIFDDDVGFLAAIKTFMTTTKRPVILTTNDRLFRERFIWNMEEIIFKAPSEVNVCSYLQLVVLTEDVLLQLDDVRSLLRLFGGDVRRCLLQLQLWVHSGGGRVSHSEGLPREHIHVQSERGNNADSQLPQCVSNCTASTLGLHSVTPKALQSFLQASFYNTLSSWSTTDMNNILRLLAESWRRAVPLLYSNLELFLPTGDKGTLVQPLDMENWQQSELTLSTIHPCIQQLEENVHQKKSDTASKSQRTASRLSRRKYVTPVFDTTSTSNLIQTQRISSPSKKAHLEAHSLRDKAEKYKAKVVTNSLDALTDFFDLMSYIDATLPAAVPAFSGSCEPEAFVWTGAEMKDGLLDEMREEGEGEGGRSWNQERLLDIQAAVEGLGCRRCCWRVSEGWSKAQKYRHDLGGIESGRPVEKRTQPVLFAPPLCEPSVSQRRYKLSKKILCSKPFSLLGNRRAVSVDYIPALRCICRYQRAAHTEEPDRCRKYLSRNRLNLSKSILHLLAEDFS
ncbi:ATPase family AAA domain-containing protein 5b isoform X2 [Xyrichtys novacula]|uniref:ATPase family AAA domain-containing protein 5b isoform X2 n=1 Tax=Xyrichtys novacula TaxID=13765 RepID=A0AAV1EY26_XYRNO|nr:ATPase family AAA domain-containing protein 5b isoform X2 [Xyrichtys novacula]